MLISLSTGKMVDRIPTSRREMWGTIISRLSKDDLKAIFEEIETLTTGKKISVSSWIPKSRCWTDTPFQVIYDKAAKENYELAGYMFGLIVWVYFNDDLRHWGFGHFTDEIQGLTYFLI